MGGRGSGKGKEEDWKNVTDAEQGQGWSNQLGESLWRVWEDNNWDWPIRYENMEAIDDHNEDGFIRHLWSQTEWGWILRKMGSEEVDSFYHLQLTHCGEVNKMAPVKLSHPMFCKQWLCRVV